MAQQEATTVLWDNALGINATLTMHVEFNIGGDIL